MKVLVLLAALVCLPVQAAETGRIAYALGPMPTMPDGDHIIDILMKRLRPLGLNPSVRQQGSELRVEVDTVENQDAVALILTRPGVFSVHANPFAYYACGGESEGRICLENRSSGDPYMIVDAEPVLGPDAIRAAEAVPDAGAQGALLLTFSAKAAEAFADLTKASIGKPVAIALDNVVVFAPVIREPILGGKAMISGNDLNVEAWAVILSQPSLPEPLEILDIQVVSP